MAQFLSVLIIWHHMTSQWHTSISVPWISGSLPPPVMSEVMWQPCDNYVSSRDDHVIYYNGYYDIMEKSLDWIQIPCYKEVPSQAPHPLYYSDKQTPNCLALKLFNDQQWRSSVCQRQTTFRRIAVHSTSTKQMCNKCTSTSKPALRWRYVTKILQ